MSNMTLPTNSAERKEVPLFSGCFTYFPAALAGVARRSKMGNDEHHAGEPLHHDRGKSRDHEDCILRHLMDLADLRERHYELCQSRSVDTQEHAVPATEQAILAEANAIAWRALALSQELHELYAHAPLAPGAKLPGPEEEQCFCDSRGLGDPEKSCGDCPTKDYPDLKSGFTPITEMTEEDRPDTAPFDLQKALSGHPLVTRDGLRVTDFRDAESHNFTFPYDATVHLDYGTEIFSYTDRGTYYCGDRHPYDLRLDLRGVV